MRTTELQARRMLENLEARRLEVGRLRRSVKMQEGQCTRSTMRYGSVGGQGRSIHSQAWDNLADSRTVLQEKEKQLRELEQQLDGLINLLPRPRWRAVLRGRYIDGLHFAEVQQELESSTGRPFTMDQIYNLHRQALMAAEKVWPLS